jgi:hypothetical protein
MPDVYRRHIPWRPFSDDEPRPLGRHVEHDPTSRRFAYEPRTAGKRDPVRHACSISILDQGTLGSCTGNAGTADLASDPTLVGPVVALTLDEPFARVLYSDAEILDGGKGLPDEDEGSTGLSIAKVLVKRELISGYQHTFDVEAFLDALQDRPCMVGAEWRTNMDHPDAHGVITFGGTIRGGHEFLADEFVPTGHPLEDGSTAAVDMVGFRNSWGTAFGYRGRFYMAVTEVTKMLKSDGDVTVLVPATSPAPTPAPVPSGVMPRFLDDDPDLAAKVARSAARYAPQSPDQVDLWLQHICRQHYRMPDVDAD